MLKKILIGLAVLVLGFVVFVAMQPSDFRVERSAAMTWAGNDKVGEGKMTIVESRPDDAVKLKVDIVKPYEGTSTSEFAFKPEGGGTAVTWAISAQHNFMEKAFCLIMNGKKMMGDLMEKGLVQMKSVAESGPTVSSN